MLFGFKRQFAPYVENGTKRHTIRAPRKIEPRVGQFVDAYVDPRQKTMRLLGRFPIVRVEDIGIRLCNGGALHIAIEGRELSYEEAEAFLWRDGFRNMASGSAMQQATAFWGDRLASGVEWKGILVHWVFEKQPLRDHGRTRRFPKGRRRKKSKR